MASSLMVCAAAASSAVVQNTTQFFSCANSAMNGNTDEALRKITYRSAGVMSRLFARLTANTASGNTTVVLRKNGANGAETITIIGGATGEFEDTTFTDSVSAGDALNHSVSVAAGSGSVSVINITAVFAATTDTVVRHAAINVRNVGALTSYQSLSDVGLATSDTLAQADFDFNAAGDIDYLSAYVSTWTIVGTSIVALVKNGVREASASPGVYLTITGTGFWETDATRTVAITANDNVATVQETTGTGNILCAFISTEFTSTAKKFHSIYGRTGLGLGTIGWGTTNFWPIGGGGSNATTEANVKTEMQIAATL